MVLLYSLAIFVIIAIGMVFLHKYLGKNGLVLLGISLVVIMGTLANVVMVGEIPVLMSVAPFTFVLVILAVLQYNYGFDIAKKYVILGLIFLFSRGVLVVLVQLAQAEITPNPNILDYVTIAAAEFLAFFASVGGMLLVQKAVLSKIKTVWSSVLLAVVFVIVDAIAFNLIHGILHGNLDGIFVVILHNAWQKVAAVLLSIPLMLWINKSVSSTPPTITINAN